MRRHNGPNCPDREAGFSLVWALLLAVALMLIGASLVQSAGSSSRSTRAVILGMTGTIEERNAMTYGLRWLEASSAVLTRDLPAPAASPAGSGSLSTQTAALQQGVAALCARSPDGGAARVRVHFTATACDRPLPAGTTLGSPQARVISPGVTYLEFPFVIVATAGNRVLTRTGTLSAQYGTPPASTYALLTPGNLTLNANLTVRGHVHADGVLTLAGADLAGTVSASGCTVSTAACTGERRATVGSGSVSVMSLTPSPARPSGIGSASLSLGVKGQHAGQVATSTTAVTVNASELTLGVLGDGGQYIKVCGMTCREYAADLAGNLYANATRTGMPVTTNWNGALNVTGSTTLRIVPFSATGPSINRLLSLTTAASTRIAGNLTYAQASCSDSVCNNGGPEVFSVNAPTITLAPDVAVHGTLSAGSLVTEGAAFVYGSVIAQPSLGGRLTIIGDARAELGIKAPLTPTLSAGWRQVTLALAP